MEPLLPKLRLASQLSIVLGDLRAVKMSLFHLHARLRDIYMISYA